MKKIFFITAIFCSSLFAVAQKPIDAQQKEQLETEKINFFTEKLGLTLDQTPKFWEIYNAYKSKDSDLRQKEVALRKKGDELTQDADFSAVIKDLSALDKERFDLRTAFQKDIAKVLTPKQVFLFLDAEKQYRELLLKRVKDINGEKNVTRRQIGDRTAVMRPVQK